MPKSSNLHKIYTRTMKKTLLTLCAVIFCLSLSAQQMVSSSNMDNFQSVVLTGNVVANLVKADTNFIDIKFFDTDVKQLKWNVSDGVLSIALRQGQIRKGWAEITIQYADTLKNISITSGELMFKDPVFGEMLDIAVKGGGKLAGEVDVRDLVMNVSGNSAAKLTGAAKYVTLSATEKSMVDVRDVDALSAGVNAATGAEVFVNAAERIVANAKTGATVFYKGNPDIVRDISSKFSTTIGASVVSIGK